MTVREVHKYWKNPCERNEPINYIKKGEQRSQFLYSIIRKKCTTDCSILEIGCNAGRNLNYLYENDYQNLNGIEINKNAVKLMKKEYPEMYKNSKIVCGSAEKKLKTFKNKSIDLIFSMAALEHIHDDSFNFIMSETKRIAKKFVITIEDEKYISDRHFPRNYKLEFEKNGFVEIESFRVKKYTDLSKKFMYRLFLFGDNNE